MLRAVEMSEVVNIPQLRFPEFGGEWKVANLGKLTHLITKGTTPNNFSDKGINFVKIEGLNGIHIKKEKCLFIDEFTHSNTLRRSMLKECDILFAIAGTVGKVGLVTAEILPANTNQALAIIRLKDKEYLNYILQILKSRVMKKYIYSSVSVGAQPNLSLKQINDFSFALPGVLEQQKIAAFLTVVDNKIELLRQKQELLGEYKKGLMQQIFSQAIRFKADDGSAFPEWEEKKLSSQCTIKKGSQLNKEHLTNEGAYPALNGGVNPSGYTTDWNTEENTITISEGGNSCGYVNFVATRFWSGGHNYSLQELKKSINVRYLYQYLKFNELRIMRLRVGSGLPNIQKGEVSNFKITLPCIEEQEKIANFLSSIDSKIDQVGKQLIESKQFKKALLQQMFV